MASMHIEQPANRSEAEESSWRWRGATRGVGKIGPDSSVDVVDVQRRACDRHFMFHATYTSVQKWSSMLRETLLLRAKTRIIDPNIDVFGSEPWALLKYSMKNKMFVVESNAEVYYTANSSMTTTTAALQVQPGMVIV